MCAPKCYAPNRCSAFADAKGWTTAEHGELSLQKTVRKPKNAFVGNYKLYTVQYHF